MARHVLSSCPFGDYPPALMGDLKNHFLFAAQLAILSIEDRNGPADNWSAILTNPSKVWCVNVTGTTSRQGKRCKLGELGR
jgi:hypothetical protein